MKRIALILSLLCPAILAMGHNILPEPQCIEIYKGSVNADRIAVSRKITGSIPGAPEGNDEAYHISVTRNGVFIEAAGEAGLFRAGQTLRQLRENGRFPICEITDWPAFPYRGIMVDAARSYIPIEELKREIRLLSEFKINVFHWHLTENQAWRLESRIYPELVSPANMTRMPGLYYTLEEARDLEAYAEAHGMVLIPEIDMPGHSGAFVRCFGCDMQSPEGMEILKKLMDEVCSTFKGEWVHIGTDEVRFTNPDFVPEMVAHVRSHGKKVISWNPGWNYKAGEIDMTQMWSYRGKPSPGIPTVDSRYHYLNHFDTYADLVALYRSTIYGLTKTDGQIKGMELAIWCDRNVPDATSNIAQNNLYPLSMAMAERAWTGGGTEYFDTLGTNLDPAQSDDFQAFADFERRMIHHKSTTLSEVFIPYIQQSGIHWHITDAFPNEGELTRIFPPETEGPGNEYTYEGKTYGVRTATGGGIYLRHVWGDMVPGFYKSPKPNHTAYAFAEVYSPKAQTAGLQFETQNYSRSEPDIPPRQGKWDYRESHIWINGDEILPPEWTSCHTVRDLEIPLGNENCAARKPIPVNLKKGRNIIMIKLPVGEFNTPETRLVKWMFTCTLTTPDGTAPANVTYK